eukprot:TRINITY_DN27397_c0_g1_i1.p2 TRINITY_DN27397_c0_g1~~TRINITY_DN27397_c0_g1_i1.p2  ORF type:complete len:236 (+),score=42.78 TRINITY_DN27397_c0_g1_i1:140-847(+)
MGCGAAKGGAYKKVLLDHDNNDPTVEVQSQQTVQTVHVAGVSSPCSSASVASQFREGPLGAQGLNAEETYRPPSAVSQRDDLRCQEQDAWIQQRASETLDAYNFFFEHIGIRKGWRTPPFQKEEVQVPFWAAAWVVSSVRSRLDEASDGGVVLRQLEGSAMDFMWGWPPGRQLSEQENAQEFYHDLVFATLSDARGLVEGLDKDTVEQYVQSYTLPSVAPQTIGDTASGASSEGS